MAKHGQALANRRQQRQKGRGRVGFVSPPLGTYDPGLDAQRRAGDRGLGDLKFDTRVGRKRARQDLGTRTELARRKSGRALEQLGLTESRGREDLSFKRADIGTTFTRAVQDLEIARQRGGEDYARTLGTIQRQFDDQALQQTSQQAATGTERGGGAAGASAIREANQRRAREPVDTSHARLEQDIALRGQRAGENRDSALARLGIGEGRLGQDVATKRGQIGQDLGTQLGLYRRDFKRDRFDTKQKLSRATRENALYQTDVTQQEYYQAHQFNPKIKFPSINDVRSGNLPRATNPQTGRPVNMGRAQAGRRPRRPRAGAHF